MLDARVRRALLDFQQGRETLEATAQLLARVRRETGCLELHAADSAGEAERALLARFAEIVAADIGGEPIGGAPAG